MFKVDKEINQLSVFEYGDISSQVNPLPRLDMVKVKHTTISLLDDSDIRQSSMWESDAGRFLEGDDYIGQIRHAHGYLYR